MTAEKPLLPLTEALVTMYHDALWKRPDELAYLHDERGLTDKTLRKYQIGWDGYRLTIPIRDSTGALINIRRYKRNAPDNKMISTKGYGSNKRVAFLDRLPSGRSRSGNRRVVLIAGGEWDALVLLQAGFTAVTSTGGEGALPNTDDLEKLRGWPVRVLLDTDDPGRAGATRLCEHLVGIAADVKNVCLPLPKDSTDWFVQHGKTAQDLVALMRDAPFWGARRDSDELVVRAEAQVSGGDSRNAAGFWLACQLRDERYPETEALQIMSAYQGAVVDLKQPPYTEAEAADSLHSAYASPPRKAVGPGSATAYMQTDLGNAERLVDRHGQDMRWVASLGWLVWDGTRWRLDEKGVVDSWANDTARAMHREAGLLPDEEERKRLRGWAKASEADARLNAMKNRAKSLPGISMLEADFDRDPMVFNCKNGVIDLRTGVLHDHRREDFCRKRSHVVYDPNATAPRWDQFLSEIMPDGDDRAFVQRSAGYWMTGSVAEEVFWILHGGGQNGKTKFCEALKDCTGDYGWQISTKTILESGKDLHPTSLAALDGVRFALANETKDGDNLNEDRIKDLVGGDTMNARRMRMDEFQFRPECKLVLRTNHKPVIRETGDSIWRRILPVEFGVKIPDEQVDRNLAAKLSAESPGILRWMVEGCLAWQRDGLAPSGNVIAAAKQYREASDLLAGFLDTCCVVGPAEAVSKADLYAAYRGWAEGAGLRPMTLIAFGRKLQDRPALEVEETRVGKRKVHSWLGIGMSDDDTVERDSKGRILLRAVPS